MNTSRLLLRFVSMLAPLPIVLATAFAQAPPAAPVMDSYYRAAERVDLPAPVQGDVVAAGRDVILGHPITGDVLAAGRSVTLTAPAHDDVRVAGGEVTLDGPIAGDITAAGRTVVIGPAAHVAGRTWLAGETIRAEGVFDRDVRLAGGTVQIAGELRQPVRVFAESLEILPGARVLAPLTYTGPTPAIVSPAATMTSPIEFHRTERRNASLLPSAGSTILFVLHVFLGGLLLYLLVPRIASEPEELLRTKPALSLGAGFALLITVPVAALLLVVTLVGLPLGLALGALYFVALFVGIVTTAFYIGSVEARWLGTPITTRRRQAGYLLAGVLTLALLRAVPVVGGLAIFFAVVFGLGGLSMWAYRSYYAAPAPERA